MGQIAMVQTAVWSKPAPEFFQMKFNQNLDCLKGVHVIAGEVIAVGKGANYEEALKDHDQNMIKLLERFRERNIKLKKTKFQLKCKDMCCLMKD